MTQDEINEAEWRTPANWSGGWLGIYRSARDARMLVPKRNPVMGFTVNFGHRNGALVLLVFVAVVLGAAFVALATSLRQP